MALNAMSYIEDPRLRRALGDQRVADADEFIGVSVVG